MTVAAVILSLTADDAIAPSLAQPRIRRIVDIAWSGGALPVIVSAPDPTGQVAAALVGSEAVLAAPGIAPSGPVALFLLGADVASSEVRDTTAVLLWPVRMTWVGPETVTSLIEAHGVDRDTVLRPTWHGEPGWPMLVPTIHLATMRDMAADLGPEDLANDLVRVLPTREIELGDPGVVHDTDTSFDDLPAYEGPPDPPAGHRHEWGEDVESAAGLPAPDGSTAG
jgi:CTP:molybdopterin cytidylyltransferase MocA